MSVSIREADASDRPALIDLWVEAWTAAMPTIDFEARRNWLSDRLDALASEGAVLLVAVGPQDAPVGFVTIDRHKREIDQLAVSVATQRSGIAVRLLDEAKQRSPAGLTLTVNAENPRALALYARAGFAVTEEGINTRSGLRVLHMLWEPAANVRRSNTAGIG